MKNFFVAMAFMAVLLSAMAYAETPNRILSNSEDWRDVYSVMLYGSLQKVNANFLVSERHASLILGQIPNTEHLWVYTSTRTPFILGYENFLTTKGYVVE